MFLLFLAVTNETIQDTYRKHAEMICCYRLVAFMANSEYIHIAWFCFLTLNVLFNDLKVPIPNNNAIFKLNPINLISADSPKKLQNDYEVQEFAALLVDEENGAGIKVCDDFMG